jgi:tRNA U54 and U55 pseudouridine synthase Pus10
LNEKTIENEIRHYVRTRGGKCVKLHGSALSGKTTLDLIGHLDGRPFVCEVKRPGKKPSPYQAYELESFAAGGYIAVWADSLTAFVSKFSKAVRDE